MAENAYILIREGEKQEVITISQNSIKPLFLVHEPVEPKHEVDKNVAQRFYHLVAALSITRW